MATAREQGREDLRRHLQRRSVGLSTAEANEAADRVSDVWEPLLREAKDLIHHLFDLLGTTEEEDLVLDRIQEALD